MVRVIVDVGGVTEEVVVPDDLLTAMAGVRNDIRQDAATHMIEDAFVEAYRKWSTA